MDAVTKVEKLNAAQQLTMTIILSSMVNIMSSEEDQCFQCKEPGHIAQHCPHIISHECDEFGHIVMPHHKAHRKCHNGSSSRNHQED